MKLLGVVKNILNNYDSDVHINNIMTKKNLNMTKHQYMGQFPQDGKLVHSVSCFWEKYKHTVAKPLEIALFSQLFLKDIMFADLGIDGLAAVR